MTQRGYRKRHGHGRDRTNQTSSQYLCWLLLNIPFEVCVEKRVLKEPRTVWEKEGTLGTLVK